MNENIAILILAVILDTIIAEPPAVIHPTVWTGRIISWIEKVGLNMHRSSWQFIFGAVASLALVGVTGYLSFLVLKYSAGINTLLYVIIAGIMLKPTFCLNYSCRLSLLVKQFLDNGKSRDLTKADISIRYLLSTVEKNDDQNLDQPIISSTVRSLVENASDFFVAPLFYFLIFGVPGAIAYRVANTLDGMIGHRGEYEYLGKFAARFDDVLNFIPARITAIIFVLASWILRYDVKGSWKIMVRDHAKTESPNAGWPMSATAGALSTQLDRAGHYALGDPNKPLSSDMIGRSVSLFKTLAAVDVTASVGILFLLYLVI